MFCFGLLLLLSLLPLSFLFLRLFQDNVSCSPGLPPISYITEDDLELEILLPPLPQCTTMPGLWGTEGQTRGFMPARQAPYWPSHVSPMLLFTSYSHSLQRQVLFCSHTGLELYCLFNGEKLSFLDISQCIAHVLLLGTIEINP